VAKAKTQTVAGRPTVAKAKTLLRSTFITKCDPRAEGAMRSCCTALSYTRDCLQFASWMEMAASWRWPRVGGHLRDSAMRGGRNRGRGGRPVSESDEEDAVYGSRANDLTAHSTDSSDLDD
jgi:hypothetical protein